MFNAKFILILLNIKGFNRRIVNELLKNTLPSSLESNDILNFITSSNINSLHINIIDILNAKNISKNIIKLCNINNIKIITILDSNYPIELKIIKDNPVILFYKGNLDCIFNKTPIAIIGSRKSNIYYKNLSKTLGYYLGKKKLLVVSGLAIGCDESAHKGCLLSKGSTIAILPCGLDKIHPSSNLELANNIVKNNGCLISEYPPGTPVSKEMFIHRNRIVSALSKGLIVIEYSLNSGTNHTINYAKDQNKLLYFCNTNNNQNNFKSLNNFISSCCSIVTDNMSYCEQIKFNV